MTKDVPSASSTDEIAHEDEDVRHYQALRPGDFRFLDRLEVDQPLRGPHGTAEPTLRLVLRPAAGTARLYLTFYGVADLWFNARGPSGPCLMEIHSIHDRGWESLHYLVHDFEEERLHCYCHHFEAALEDTNPADQTLT